MTVTPPSEFYTHFERTVTYSLWLARWGVVQLKIPVDEFEACLCRGEIRHSSFDEVSV